MKPLPGCLIWECPECRTANSASMGRCAKCGRPRPVFGIKPQDAPPPRPATAPRPHGGGSMKTKGAGMQTDFVQSMMPKTTNERNGQ